MRLTDLFFIFLKIGWLTLGGGYVMIPLFLEEIVKKRNYMDEEEFIKALTLAQLFPGPIAFNLAVSVGYKLKKDKRSHHICLSGCYTILCIYPCNSHILFKFSKIKNSTRFLLWFKTCYCLCHGSCSL